MEKDPFTLTGKVEAVLIAGDHSDIVSRQVNKIQVLRDYGVRGDRHAGTRLIDVREKELLAFGFSKGTEIANHREFSAISAEELTEISGRISLPSAIPFGLLGENLVLSGIPKITQLPVGTMLFFQKNNATKRTAVLVVWGENMPCVAPGEAIAKEFPAIPNLAALFPKAALGLRGVVGSIYCSGNIHKGDAVIVKVPMQKTYAP